MRGNQKRCHIVRHDGTASRHRAQPCDCWLYTCERAMLLVVTDGILKLEIVFQHQFNYAPTGLIGIGAKPEAAVASVLDKSAAVGVCEI
jgi:hypothetical protein